MVVAELEQSGLMQQHLAAEQEAQELLLQLLGLRLLVVVAVAVQGTHQERPQV